MRALGVGGEVQVAMEVNREGRVVSRKVVHTSGKIELDMAALESVPERFGPLPPGQPAQVVRYTFRYLR